MTDRGVAPVVAARLGRQLVSRDARPVGEQLDVGVRVDFGGSQPLVTTAGTAWMAPLVVDVGLREGLIGGCF